MKTLLTFAYPKEAQCFIENPLPDVDILITNEGLTSTLFHVTKALTKNDYSKVINFGIAGGLTNDLKLNQIFPVKTIYAQNEFKSFQTKLEGENLISAQDRIKTQNQKSLLSFHASIVDREAWAIAFACDKFNIDFECYKLISDFSDETLACDLIVEQAFHYSQLLYNYYQSLNSTSSQKTHFITNDYYTTYSQKNQINNLLNKLSIKLNLDALVIFKNLDHEHIKAKSSISKEQTKYLIQELQLLLNPWMANFEIALKKEIQKYSGQGIQIEIDPNYEKANIDLILKLKSQQDLKKSLSRLQDTNLEELFALLNGEDDVL